MKNDTLTPALQNLLARFSEGFTIPELQSKLYREFKFLLSYKEIENAFFRHPEMFSEDDGRWRLRTER